MALGTLAITGEKDADGFLNSDPLALLVGMLLDQQVPMEWAFMGPYRLRERLGGDLDARRIAAASPEEVESAFRSKPALHRYPASMAKRAKELCEYLVEHYGGDASAVWADVATGDELYTRLRALPGYGEEKAKIFVAILAKRFGVRPEGWEQAAGVFGDATPRSVADIDGPESLARVREWKKAQKAAGKSKSD